MSEIIVITSEKGRVGKTTTSNANVGTGLDILEKKVVLIDTDIGLRNLDVVMGLGKPHCLQSCRCGRRQLPYEAGPDKRQKISKSVFSFHRLRPGTRPSVNRARWVKLVDDLRESSDYVLLDCLAGIEQGLQNAIAGADRALMVTTPEVSAIRDADRIIGRLEVSGMKTIDLVVNRIRMIW